MRVLIADDQRSFATALADMVRYCGHDIVAIVGSGLEAIQAYTLHKPDLVLMDHRMPKLSGVTASRHIIAKNPEARVILLSAWSPLDCADESGAICFLPKPVELARLNATLLTISQSISPPAPGPEEIFNNGYFGEVSFAPVPDETFVSESSDDTAPRSAEIIPIPQEIISPIETFPVDIFPLEFPASQNDVDQNKIVPLPVNRKSPRKRRRNVRRRARAC